MAYLRKDIIQAYCPLDNHPATTGTALAWNLSPALRWRGVNYVTFLQSRKRPGTDQGREGGKLVGTFPRQAWRDRATGGAGWHGRRCSY